MKKIENEKELRELLKGAERICFSQKVHTGGKADGTYRTIDGKVIETQLYHGWLKVGFIFDSEKEFREYTENTPQNIRDEIGIEQ